jgi:hypothetical protein
VRTLRRMIAAGDFMEPTCVVGTQPKFESAAVEAWIAAGSSTKVRQRKGLPVIAHQTEATPRKD